MKAKTTSPHAEAEASGGLDDAALERIEGLTTSLLEELGETPDREGLVRTPNRVARAWRDLTKGYHQSLDTLVNQAIFEATGSEMVVVRDIEVMSLCEHHLLPFYGRCHVAYLPNESIIGLSKIARIVDMFARRLQVQERLTRQVAEAVDDTLAPHGVGVVIEARHMCMMMRGVEKAHSFTSTSALIGAFADDASTRAEFMSLVSTRMNT